MLLLKNFTIFHDNKVYKFKNSDKESKMNPKEVDKEDPFEEDELDHDEIFEGLESTKE